ncbi:MAG: pirin family protein, partial [Nitrospinota bacterium]|nr:pirin family protein [Nitrospinota bacterium]
GELEHKDSLGHESVLRPGDVQRMTAGTGVTHSEFNHSKVEPVHILQTWIQPDTKGMKPDYEQKNFPINETLGAFRLIGSPDGREGSITIHQDVNLFTTSLEQGQGTEHRPAPDRYGWLQVVRGSAELNGQNLKAGDGAALEAEEALRVVGTSEENEILLFDLA